LETTENSGKCGRPWQKSYPPGVRWDAPIATSTLPELLTAAILDFGAKPAFEYRDRRISYAEFGTRVDRAAAGLRSIGVGPGTVVALYLPNTPYYPIFFFAVTKLGGVVAQMSPLDAERELGFKLSDSGARILITTDIGPFIAMAHKLLAARAVDQVVVGEEKTWRVAGEAVEATALNSERMMTASQINQLGTVLPSRWPTISPDDLAVLQYTGGTTGTPKGAMITHANLTAALSMYKAWGQLQGRLNAGEGRIICVLPLFHIYGLTVILLYGLATGAELLLRTRFDVETTLRDIECKRATRFGGVPTMWIAIANYPGVDKRDFSSLELIGSGGGPCPVEIETKIAKLTGLQLGGGWGMTETSPAGTSIPLDRPDKIATIGVPLPGIELDIVALDNPHCVLAPGEIGEIRVKGANVIRGYWKRPQENATAFVDGFLLTGDIGRMDEDGFFYILDRKKDMIISGGFNVYARVIEEAIYEHPSVAEVIVIGVADEYRGEAAKAFITLRPGQPPFSLEQLRAFLADKLGKHELPAHLEFRSSLPTTAVGKLSKKELIEEERRKAVAATRTAAPMSDR
jgi:long-chain acyl-CoA synthetase